jgi:hypothetical protein
LRNHVPQPAAIPTAIRMAAGSRRAAIRQASQASAGTNANQSVGVPTMRM